MPESPLVPFGWDARVAARFAALDPAPHWEPARVVRVERSACLVTTAAGDRLASARVLPAVGDWVAVERHGEQAVVHDVVDRWSALARRDPDSPRDHVLAANLDVAFVAAPADRPNAARVEREIVLVWDSGAVPVVVVTKTDLATSGDDRSDFVAELAGRLVGVDVIATSGVRGDGVDAVRERLQPCRTAVLLGPSGAGKSTLANALLGSDRLVTGAVRDADQRGRHTTTWRELVVVPTGGVLIDTPGLRSVGLRADDGALGAAFADVEDLAAGCRFGDCRHEREPGCEVRAAIDAGTLRSDRLASYQKLQRELAFEQRRVDPVARHDELRRWKQIHKAARARTRRDPRNR